MKHSVKELRQIIKDNNVIGVEFYKPIGKKLDWSIDFNKPISVELNCLPTDFEFDCDYELFDEGEYNENIIPNTSEIWVDFREEYPPEMIYWADKDSPVLVMCIRINDFYEFSKVYMGAMVHWGETDDNKETKLETIESEEEAYNLATKIHVDGYYQVSQYNWGDWDYDEKGEELMKKVHIDKLYYAIPYNIHYAFKQDLIVLV